MSPRRAATPPERLRVDPVVCDGVGQCALLAPDVVELDRWGFPVILGHDLTRGQTGQARRAVRGCPRKALWLERAAAPVHAPGAP